MGSFVAILPVCFPYGTLLLPSYQFAFHTELFCCYPTRLLYIRNSFAAILPVNQPTGIIISFCFPTICYNQPTSQIRKIIFDCHPTSLLPNGTHILQPYQFAPRLGIFVNCNFIIVLPIGNLLLPSDQFAPKRESFTAIRPDCFQTGIFYGHPTILLPEGILSLQYYQFVPQTESFTSNLPVRTTTKLFY